MLMNQEKNILQSKSSVNWNWMVYFLRLFIKCGHFINRKNGASAYRGTKLYEYTRMRSGLRLLVITNYNKYCSKCYAFLIHNYICL